MTSLPPGPELDAVVCRLLGINHPWDESRCRVCGWPLYKELRDGCTATSCAQRPAPRPRADAYPPVSTDRYAGLRVLDKLVERGCDVVIHCNAEDHTWV